MNLVGRTALLGVVLVLCLGLGTSACSDDDGTPTSGESSAPPLPSGRPEAFEIETRTTLGRVVGKLGKDERQRAQRVVTDLVQGWFNAAYVGGDYPRTNFRDAFPGFTPGARDEARRDGGLMTNQKLGANVEDVTPTKSRIVLDLLAVRDRAVGATARFQLGFRAEGDRTRKVRVSGRLLLSRQDSGWRIFGYDVSKGGRSA